MIAGYKETIVVTEELLSDYAAWEVFKNSVVAEAEKKAKAKGYYPIPDIGFAGKRCVFHRIGPSEEIPKAVVYEFSAAFTDAPGSLFGQNYSSEPI